MALTSILLAPGGEMVSITPRSFCNGVYFKSFRRDFLGYMSIEKIHSFESRTQAFKDDKVLQENIILKTRKSAMPSPTIQVSLTLATNMDVRTVEVPRHQVVAPDDKDAIIHVITEELESRVSPMAGRLTYTLRSLGLEVSTGPVVDFRATEYIVQSSNKKAVPLIYPYHMYQGYVNWPALNPKKPDGLLSIPETRRLLLPLGYYVVVKRFSSKEQKRRITAALYDASRFKFKFVGFENHLNYIHAGADGLDSTVAKGLVAFLNSTVVDSMFRLFSGHTQVNADDLRRLKYPSLDELKSIGMQIGEEFPDQNTLDRIINTIIGTHS
jgi:adenine-specific DNA-methyltransferase